MKPLQSVWPVCAFLMVCVLPAQPAQAETCDRVVHEFNTRMSPKIDEQELVDILRSLNSSNNKKLPPKFVTKQAAKAQGWKPGKDLWSVRSLKGSSMGGDRFNNREGRLPDSKWREADLDYRGGHRGAKRLVFSGDGRRAVTVDHYRTFHEVSACQ
jgi:hypothetical protein